MSLSGAYTGSIETFRLNSAEGEEMLEVTILRGVVPDKRIPKYRLPKLVRRKELVAFSYRE